MPNQFSQFNRQNLVEFRQKLQNVLDAFGEANGLKLNMGTIRFSPGECGFKVKTRIKSLTNNVMTPIMVGNPGSTNPIRVGDRYFRGRTTYTVTSVDRPGKFSIGVTTERGKAYKIKPAFLLEMQKL